MEGRRIYSFGFDFARFRCNLLVEGAFAVAKYFGLSEVITGLTVISIETSLPDLATPAIAAEKGEADIAPGNAIGSNVLNILAI